MEGRKKARKEPSKPAKPALLPEKATVQKGITYTAQHKMQDRNHANSHQSPPAENMPLPYHESSNSKGKNNLMLCHNNRIKVIANAWQNAVPTPSQGNWTSCLWLGLGWGRFGCILNEWYFWQNWFLLPEVSGSNYINLLTEGSFRVYENSFIL